MRILGIISAAVTAALLSFSAQASEWVPAGADYDSCDLICSSKDLAAISSGIYTPKKEPYYICRIDHGKYGKRPGANVKTEHAGQCSILFNGGAVRNKVFDCLCK